MLKFDDCRPFIENEFEMAVFDKNTGWSVSELSEYLKGVQEQKNDLPREIVCAEAYAFLLDHVQLQINEHTPFAVKFNIGVDYSGFASIDIFQKCLFCVQREKIMQEKFLEDYEKMLNDHVSFGTYTDFWHTVPNWDYILKVGFPGILSDARASRERLLASNEHEEKQIVFLDSVIICYEAILRLLHRIYEYSLNFNVPDFSACVKALAERAPQTLYEAMQFSVLFLYVEEIGCERGRTLGAIDSLYYPYYNNDLSHGVLQSELDELFRFFFIHFTATKRFAEQPFTLGGSNADGTDRANELTLRILDIYDGMGIYDPKIHLRYHRNINRAVLVKAVSMIRRGNSSFCILNDSAVFAGYERLGISREDCANYVLLGCYEPIIMGLEEAEIGIAWINAVKFIEFALTGGKDIMTGRQSGLASKTAENFDEFLGIFFDQLDYYADLTLDFAIRQSQYTSLINPSPIYSSTFPACLEKGTDVHKQPLKYNNMSIKFFGMATVVDSLVAIKKFVFDKKEISLSKLCEALRANWEGYGALRERILMDADKYGNNRPLPDSLLVAITEHIKEKYCARPVRDGKLRVGLDSIDTCIIMGRLTAATPDGRAAKAPVSKNLCAVEGKDRGGITAYMQSLLKIDFSGFLNGAPLDFILHPSAVEGEKGLQDFISLIEVYFANGGFAMQGNVFNLESLKDAQEHPEKYETLQVRVCGWNEYFVKMSREKQDMFIRQCEVQGK